MAAKSGDARPMSKELQKRSKALSYWLRHMPADAGIELDAEGWAPTELVLHALNRQTGATDMALLERVVAENDKQRFEFSEDKSQIRARQGHSIEVDAGWTPADPPETLYHGTVEKFFDAILAQGLKPMRRHHVHLSADIATASKVGERRGKPVILRVAARELARHGAEFSLSSNGVWLVAAVPPEYLSRLDQAG